MLKFDFKIISKCTQLSSFSSLMFSLQVLQTILGLERLDRMTSFAEELIAGVGISPASSLVSMDDSLVGEGWKGPISSTVRLPFFYFCVFLPS